MHTTFLKKEVIQYTFNICFLHKNGHNASVKFYFQGKYLHVKIQATTNF